VDQLRGDFNAVAPAIRSRLRDFALVQDDAIFYELVYCLLTPQSSAEHAEAAVEDLRANRFREDGTDPTPILRNTRSYIRFHRTKARRLVDMRAGFANVLEALQLSRSIPNFADTEGQPMRLWLVDHVCGLGWKEASHFLRNIGYRHLGILDRHILKNLQHHGVLDAIPRSLTPNRYRAIETAFLQFAGAVGIPMDELDLLFWSRETGAIRK
jgi:N-glycosylase/DNA lyase